MKLTHLKITGFRNLSKLAIDIDQTSNVIAFIGENGHGKTNLLESIFLLGISKSFRAKESSELIGHDQTFCNLQADLDENDKLKTFSFVLTAAPKKKTLKINGVVKPATEYVGQFPVVFFSPDDIGMVYLAPSVRRRYLDVLISQLDSDYVRALLSYQSALKQRNVLLRSIADKKVSESQLDAWDQTIAKYGKQLIDQRRSFIPALSERMKDYYQQVSEDKDEFELRYSTTVDRFETDAEYIECLVANRTADLAARATQIGPHRDDLHFLCNKRNMASFGSRGEIRSAVLALKFAEIELLKKEKRTEPVLLLDDVFSELDDKRQRLLFKLIDGSQTFVSTTHHEFLDVIDSPKQIFTVSEGCVELQK